MEEIDYVEECSLETLGLNDITIPINVSYLAGLVDGEGSINIIRQGRSWMMKLRICMTNLEVLELVRDKFGGIVCGPYVHKNKPHHKPTWEWIIHSGSAYALLKELYPRLIIKKEEAHIAIDFYRACYELRSSRNQWNPLTDEEIEYRETWRFALQAAKVKSVNDWLKEEEVENNGYEEIQEAQSVRRETGSTFWR